MPDSLGHWSAAQHNAIVRANEQRARQQRQELDAARQAAVAEQYTPTQPSDVASLIAEQWNTQQSAEARAARHAERQAQIAEALMPAPAAPDFADIAQQIRANANAKAATPGASAVARLQAQAAEILEGDTTE